MPKFKYVSNKNANDGTTEIVPDPEDRERSVRLGEEIALSEKEATALRERFNLEESAPERTDTSRDDASRGRQR